MLNRWNKLHPAEKKSARFSFQLNSKLSVDQISTLLQSVSQKNMNTILSAGRSILSLFILDHVSPSAQTKFLSPQSLAAYMEIEVWNVPGEEQEQDDVSTSSLFLFFLCLLYLENPFQLLMASSVIPTTRATTTTSPNSQNSPTPQQQPPKLQLAKNASAESRDAVHKVVEIYVDWFCEHFEETKNDDGDDSRTNISSIGGVSSIVSATVANLRNNNNVNTNNSTNNNNNNVGTSTTPSIPTPPQQQIINDNNHNNNGDDEDYDNLESVSQTSSKHTNTNSNNSSRNTQQQQRNRIEDDVDVFENHSNTTGGSTTVHDHGTRTSTTAGSAHTASEPTSHSSSVGSSTHRDASSELGHGNQTFTVPLQAPTNSANNNNSRSNQQQQQQYPLNFAGGTTNGLGGGGSSSRGTHEPQQQQQQPPPQPPQPQNLHIPPPEPHHLVAFNLEQFNIERVSKGVLSTMPVTVKIQFASKTGTFIDSFGKFCCGGKRTAGADLVWSETNAGNIAHHFECPFHPLNLERNRNRGMSIGEEERTRRDRNNNNNHDDDDDMNTGGIRPLISLQRYHSGVINLVRTTKSAARKSHSIANWTCCGNDAVKAHATNTYEFIPETENGCCNKRLLPHQAPPPPSGAASASYRHRSASPKAGGYASRGDTASSANRN